MNIKRLIHWGNSVERLITIEIVVSQNAPSEQHLLSDIQLTELQNLITNQRLTLLTILQERRLGPGEHFRDNFYATSGNWVVWIGDDDLLDYSYLNTIEQIIVTDTEKKVSSIESKYLDVKASYFFDKVENYDLPSLIAAYSSRNVDSIFHKFNAALRGQQLSGLVFRREVIDTCYKTLTTENLYPWICFLKYAQQVGNCARVFDKLVYVTSDTPKTFSFGKLALIPDIYDAIAVVPNINWFEKRVNGILVFYWPFVMCMLDYSARNAYDLPKVITNLFKEKRISKLDLLIGLPGIIYYGLRLGFTKRDLPKRFFK